MAAVSAGTWELYPTVKEASMKLFFPQSKPESVFGSDTRVLVNPKHFGPGGKYRSIVKLEMHYEYQPPGDLSWAMGTGWLVRPDVLVTAGHCVYDWDHGLGRCVKVKAYIGYNGASSVTNPEVQFRHGVKVVTTGLWLQNDGHNTPNDVAFIQLDQPFTDIKSFSFRKTPLVGNAMLGVVGYPGDKRYNNDPKGEEGAQMYESFSSVEWNLKNSGRNVLDYQIDTYAGQSGSPVLRQSDLKVIGTHVLGGGRNNSAGVIWNGVCGNQYESYISVFDNQYPTIKQNAGITYVNVPPQRIGSEALINSSSSEEFWEDMKTAIMVARPITYDVLDSQSLALGPLSGPIAALIGTALRVAIGFAGPEGSSSERITHNAHVYRAIVAEAALWVVEDMDKDTVRDMEIVETMKEVHADASQAKRLAPGLFPALMDPMLRVALNALQERQNGTESNTSWVAHPQNLEFSMHPGSTSEFTHKMLSPTVRETDDDCFWNVLGDILSTAGEELGQTMVPGESFKSPYSKPEDEANLPQHDKNLVDFTNRAVMGEAALQALQKIDPQYLESEGLFASLKSMVQKIGPTVLKLSPGVAEAAVQIVTAAQQS